jgi:APA family basic amino acid/polyamine antiporter
VWRLAFAAVRSAVCRLHPVGGQHRAFFETDKHAVVEIMTSPAAIDPAVPPIARPFGVWTASALVVGGMIGTGIFMLPTSLAPFGWTGVLAWAISIVGILAVAYALGRLSAEMPHATGAIEVTGAVLGDLAGVLIGWSYWVSCWTSCAMLAIGATSYLSVFVPALNASPLAGASTSIALLWLITLLNLGGPRLAGRFQVATTVLKLLPLIVVVVIAALLVGSGDRQLPPLPQGTAVLTGLSSAVTLTLFAFVGFEAASVTSDRVKDPQRTIMRATMIGTLLTGLLYIAVCTGIVFTVPAAAVAASDAPFALFFEAYWGHGAALLVALFAAISAIGALNCWVLIQGEVPLGMARAGLLPRWFAGVSARDVPVRVLILSTMLASILIMSNASRSLGGLFMFIALLTTCASLWLYLAVCIAALVRGVAKPAALVGLPFIGWAMWGAGVESGLLSLILMLAAVPLYVLRGHRRPRA